jgi:glucarate dehydratase
MRIKKIIATPINLPLEAPYIWAASTAKGFSTTIVEIVTDEGLVGLGEAPSPHATAIIEDEFAPRLIGHDVFDIAGMEALCLPGWNGVPDAVNSLRLSAFSGLEMALWDLRGKAWGQPLCQLLGGAVRREVAYADFFTMHEVHELVQGDNRAEAVAEYCIGLHERFGTTQFDSRFALADPSAALNMLDMIRRQLGPDIFIRADTNGFYPAAVARRMARRMDELNISSWVDPVRTFDDMVELRRHCVMPFASRSKNLAHAMMMQTPDAMCGNPAGFGGISRMVRFIGACEHTGMEFWCRGGYSAIGSAAMLHISAAFSWITQPGHSMFRMQLEDVVEEGPFTPRHNLLALPEGNGLGVTLSMDRLGWCHQQFMNEGGLAPLV